MFDLHVVATIFIVFCVLFYLVFRSNSGTCAVRKSSLETMGASKTKMAAGAESKTVETQIGEDASNVKFKGIKKLDSVSIFLNDSESNCDFTM